MKPLEASFPAAVASRPQAKVRRKSLLLKLCLGLPTALFLGLPTALLAQSRYTTPYTFLNLAGTENTGEADGVGGAARFDSPLGMATDPQGNLILADYSGTVRRVTLDGVVTTIAGAAGQAGSNDGPGPIARFGGPTGVAVDAAGIIYVCDSANNTIRKIDTNGVTSTLAGLAGSAGAKDGDGAEARFSRPYNLTVDPTGNLYVTDRSNNTIRKVTPQGVVTTIAGIAGKAGDVDGGYGTNLLNQPRGICLDTNGNLFIATYDCLIRMIAPGGVMTTVAGSPNSFIFSDGVGAAASFNDPFGVITDTAGNLYVSDLYNCAIRKIAPGGVVTTIAGNSAQCGAQDGPAATALFHNPTGMAFDAAGNLYVADTINNSIRKLTPAGAVSTFAGPLGSGSVDALGSAARFYAPEGLALDPEGNLWVGDTYNHTIRKVTPEGLVTTIAGIPGTHGTNDGSGTNALFDYPTTMVFDAATNLYICDTGNNTIRKLDVNGNVTTFAGVPFPAYGTNDGPAATALFNGPEGIALDSHGNLFVCDTGNNTIRKIATNGLVSTYAGRPGKSGTANGGLATSEFNSPSGCATDTNDNLYIADYGNNVIRLITPAGQVSTFAGSMGNAGSDDRTGLSAQFNQPINLRADAQGNLFVADLGNGVIRKITAARVVTTIAGSPGQYKQSVDGTGSAARFSAPADLVITDAGVLYVADSDNTIRVGYSSLALAVNLQALGVSGGVARFLLSGAPGQTAVLMGSSDLSAWTPVSTNTLSATPTSVSDSQSVGKPWRFYRAVVP